MSDGVSSLEEAKKKYKHVNKWLWIPALGCLAGVIALWRRAVDFWGVMEIADTVGFGFVLGFALRDWRAWVDAWGVLQAREREELLSKISKKD